MVNNEEDYTGETLLLRFNVDFADEVSYGKYNFIPVGTQCILLNEDAMIVGIWGKTLLARTTRATATRPTRRSTTARTRAASCLFPVAEEVSRTETNAALESEMMNTLNECDCRFPDVTDSIPSYALWLFRNSTSSYTVVTELLSQLRICA